MSMTFSDSQTFLSILLGDSNTSSSDAWPLATRKFFLNRGELAFARDTKLLREKTTGTISGTSLTLPSDWLQTTALIVNNRNLLNDRQVSVQDYERWYTSGSSWPAYYLSEESSVRAYKFFGSSDGQAYTLYYVKKPDSLTDDSDESSFPDEFREASAYWAASELLQQPGKNQVADKYKGVYLNYVRDAQKYVVENFIERNYANPDTNTVDSGQTDVAGGGYDYA